MIIKLYSDCATVYVSVNMQNRLQVCMRVSSTLVMVMLITCVVLRRLTDEVGFFRAESSSILCSLLVLGDEKEGKLSMGMK